MRNFLRCVRSAWAYRKRLVISLVCAAAAAGLWSVNFLAIHPVMTLLSGKGLVEATDDDIQKLQAELQGPAGLQKQLDDAYALLEKYKAGFRDFERVKAERDQQEVINRLEDRINRAGVKLHRLQYLKTLYIRFLPGDKFPALAVLIGLVVLLVALKGAFEFAQESLVGSAVNLTQFDLRNRFFRHALRLDVRQFSDAGSHELMARFTNDVEMLGAGLKTLFGRVVAEPLKALGCIILAMMISWQLTLMFLVLVPAALFILTKVGRLMKRASRRLLERMSNIYKILQEAFQGIRIVKAFTTEARERRRFRRATLDYYRRAMQMVNLDALTSPIVELLGVASVAIALLAGAYLVVTGETHLFTMRMTDRPMDHETLLTFYGLLAAIADPIRKLSSVYTKLQSGAAAADRVYDCLDRQPRVTANALGPRVPPHGDAIEFRDVCFSYVPDEPVLTDVHFRVRFGETVALVGPNGCGKTTLISLLPRFHDPDHGAITIDNVNIRAADLRSLRRQIGLVTQETVLFDDTIFANIAYGLRRATPEQVESAARRAFAHDFILQQPQGYQTRVGEAGGKLSGGQKQRLGLARAILRDPRILILDEFTSQIDSESEALIHEALRTFMRGRTTFIITHRLHTLEIADRIVVLDQGRVAAVGTHAELVHSCAVYQRLHEAHFQRRVA